MAKLYLDECVPVSLTPLLAQHGHDVTTAMQLGLRQRNDPFHLKYASTQERILITTNQSDFRLLHRFWITMQAWDVLVSSHPGILSTAIRQLDEQAFAQAIANHLSQQGTVLKLAPGCQPIVAYWKALASACRRLHSPANPSR